MFKLTSRGSRRQLRQANARLVKDYKQATLDYSRLQARHEECGPLREQVAELEKQLMAMPVGGGSFAEPAMQPEFDCTHLLAEQSARHAQELAASAAQHARQAALQTAKLAEAHQNIQASLRSSLSAMSRSVRSAYWRGGAIGAALAAAATAAACLL
jgi:hypothetical protein